MSRRTQSHTRPKRLSAHARTSQLPLGLRRDNATVGQVLDRIRNDSRDESEKGRWFENLVVRVLLENPEYEVVEVHRWADWPERLAETELGGGDIGIDLVARHATGDWIAVQCKCYAQDARVGKSHVDSFLAAAQLADEEGRPVFGMRWIVATCAWTKTAEGQIGHMSPPVRRIDFLRHGDDPIAEELAARPVRDPWPLQAEAIDDVVAGLRNHDRGRLIMACGTGKTFTSLRIAERVVSEGGRILFLAPSIALVSQARREWLRHTTRELDCRVVCSDSTAGGRGETGTDIGLSELECAVTSDPRALAAMLSPDGGAATRVVFCTYQSLHRVAKAQDQHGAPAFDLALMDEAHRTTGVTLWAREHGGTVAGKSGGTELGKSGSAAAGESGSTALGKSGSSAVGKSGSTTVGKSGKSGFRLIHDQDALRASRRLYMTATPRIYSASSRRRMDTKGIETVDMGDLDVYGPELHRLTFGKAVNAGMLSDYRVVVLGIHEDRAPPGVTSQLISLGDDEGSPSRPLVVSAQDVTRLLGTSLAVNGAAEGPEAERPGRLYRTIAFANSIARSSFYAKGMKLPELRRITTRRLRKNDAEAEGSLPVDARHLDASDSALTRNQALRDLGKADSHKVARLLFNVGLFGEGVDVPSLDAVVFMEPRQSQIDIVQAVGRVMRKSPGKRFGYIVVPIPIEPGADLAAALASGTHGYKALGKVLRALQAHDGRLAEDPLRFVQASSSGNGGGDGGNGQDSGQLVIDLADVSQGIFAHVVEASGLGKPGLQVSQDIEHAVRAAARLLVEGEVAQETAAALGLPADADDGNICTIASLLLANACLLHRRLGDVPGLEELARLSQVGGAADPNRLLQGAWRQVLKRDYAPVFEPAMAVLAVLPSRRWAGHALRILAECANRVADSLSELGYDHAGPLYHRILPDAKSYGAFYTNNLSALMLARLALDPDFCDWSDPEAVARLRIMDPACGTGTLLMAALHVIKKRVAEALEARAAAEAEGAAEPGRSAGGRGEVRGVPSAGHQQASASPHRGARRPEAGDPARLHRTLVENVLCGLDVNRHAIQLAACNLTLGAPTANFKRMNLLTLKHGPQADGSMRAGSLDILDTADRQDSLPSLVRPLRTLDGLSAEQVDSAVDASFPLRDLHAVVMNPPFTNNTDKNKHYGPAVVQQMRKHEMAIRNRVIEADPDAAGVISNSVGTYFTPIAERLLSRSRGVLAKVIPVTACINSSGLAERRYLARRFHIERIVTSHDPRRIAFSENTGIHECLLVARRRGRNTDRRTELVSLRRMPATPEEALAAADAMLSGDAGEWGRIAPWPAGRIREGDWSAVQWFDANLAEAVQEVQESPLLEAAHDRYPIGPAGSGARVAYEECARGERDAVRLFWSVSAGLRQTLQGEPESWRKPRDGKKSAAMRLWQQRSCLLVAERYDTIGGRITALWTSEPSVGSGWLPVGVKNSQRAKAVAAWWNSTPARLMLLNQRSRKLTYPRWSLTQLRMVRIPKRDNPAWNQLAVAFARVRRMQVLPLHSAGECRARRVIDEAAAAALGVSVDRVADWRRRLALEPTVTGRARPGKG